MRELSLTVARVLYLLSPLLFSAALSGVVLRWDLFHFLKRPIDAGSTFRGRRLFGDSKTWRGVATAVVGSMLAVAAQRYLLWPQAQCLAIVDYGRVNPALLGLALGGGATAGELPNSFTKRQLDIPPGGTTRGFLAVVFYLWDQLDLLVFTWPLLLFWIRPTVGMVGASIFLALTVHPLVAVIGYLIGARTSMR
jgi:CDP-archaeol synthase